MWRQIIYPAIIFSMLCQTTRVNAQTARVFEIKSSVAANGGGNVAGGLFTIESTIGEALAGDQVSGGSFGVLSGYQQPFSNSCLYTLNPNNVNVPASSNNGAATVITSVGCGWNSASNDSWITITSGGSGSGTGSVNYTVAANSGAARAGTISVGGKTYTVNQASSTAPQSFEADVNPRPNQAGNPNPGQSGDGIVASGDVTQIRRFALGLDTPDTAATNEKQKADCAPLATFGDGIIASGDVTQARRYALGLDTKQVAFGALKADKDTASQSNASAVDLFDSKSGANFGGNPAASVAATAISRVGNTLTVGIVMNTDAADILSNSLSFTLNFVTADLTDPTNIRLGSGGKSSLGNSANLATNPAQSASGRLGFLLDLPPNETFAPGAQQLVLIDFTVTEGASASTTVSFSDTTTPHFIADLRGNRLDAGGTFKSSAVSITGQAATASVGGRVLTANGKGIRNVVVSMTDSNGSVKTTTTAELGYYKFANVEVGAAYTLEVKAKNYSFSQPSQSINVAGDTIDINFIGTNSRIVW